MTRFDQLNDQFGPAWITNDQLGPAYG